MTATGPGSCSHETWTWPGDPSYDISRITFDLVWKWLRYEGVWYTKPMQGSLTHEPWWMWPGCPSAPL